MADAIVRLKKDSILMGNMSTLSRNGRYLASTMVSRLVIRDVQAIAQILQIHQCLDKIEKLEFSPDSEYVLCGLYARSTIQVFSVADANWKCRINEGIAGLVSACWVPDSRSIITESDFGICLSVWTLTDEKHSIISMPKPNHKGFKSQFLSFCDVHDVFAVVLRVDLQDYVGIYSLHPVREVNRFKARSSDIAVLQFLTNDTHIVTVDSPLTYSCCVYNPKGELLVMYEAYQNALGVRTLACFSTVRPPKDDSEENSYAIENPLESSRAFIALGSYDGKVRLMTMYSWLVAYELPLVHPKELNPAMYAENFKTKVEISAHDFMGMGKSLKEHLFEGGNLFGSESSVQNTNLSQAISNISPESSFHVEKMIKMLPRVAPDSRGSNKSAHAPPSCGVSWIGWSQDGKYLGATEDSYSRCLWIWEAGVAKLVDLIVQIEPITCVQWRPKVDQDGIRQRENLVVFCCGTTSLYFWSDVKGLFKRENLFTSNEQNSFNIHYARWSKNGKMILLKGKETFALCHFSATEI